MLTTSFLDQYREALPIRSRGAYQLLSARRQNGTPCVLVLPGDRANPEAIAAVFVEIERVHNLIDHPQVPRVTRRAVVNRLPLLEMDCAATMDGEDVLRLIADSGERLSYAGADGLVRSLREVLQAAHAIVDPSTGRPICIGRISLRNLLFDADGRCSLVGFGRNFPLERDDGAIDGGAVFFAAPELAGGGEPSPMGDFVALLALLRPFTSYASLPASLVALMNGEGGATSEELARQLAWIDLHVLSAPPSRRATIEEAIAVSDRIRDLLAIVPDPDLLARELRALIHADARLSGRAGSAGELVLTVGADGSWIAGPNGARYRLGRALRGIVAALVERHQTSGAPLSVTDLLHAGWPGENPIPDAGANRVYVELSRLRRMGLRPVLERLDDGYRLVPGVQVIHDTRDGSV